MVWFGSLILLKWSYKIIQFEPLPIVTHSPNVGNRQAVPIVQGRCTSGPELLDQAVIIPK